MTSNRSEHRRSDRAGGPSDEDRDARSDVDTTDESTARDLEQDGTYEPL